MFGDRVYRKQGLFEMWVIGMETGFKLGLFGTELISASRLYSQYCQLFTNSLFALENASNNVLQTIKSFVFIAQNFYLFAKIPSRASIDMTNSTKK